MDDLFKRLGQSVGQAIVNSAKQEASQVLGQVGRQNPVLAEVGRHVAGGLVGGGRQAVPSHLRAAPPAKPIQNPIDMDWMDDEESDLGDMLPEYMVFEGPNKKANLKAAVAAWRLFGETGVGEDGETEIDYDDDYPGDIVAQEMRSGHAYFGPQQMIAKYAEEHGLSDGEWVGWDDPDDILSMPYDHRAIETALAALQSNQAHGMDEKYKGFHWGEEKADGTTFKQMPGVSVPLAFLGMCESLGYGKSGETFDFRDVEGAKPSVYFDPTATVVMVHGGDLRIPTDGLAFGNGHKVPGVTCAMAKLDCAHNILYAARKDGQVDLYIHEFGEDSKIKPDLYVDKTGTLLCVFGGNMHVEDRGIVD